MILHFQTELRTNTVNPDQTAPEEAFWSGFALFSIRPGRKEGNFILLLVMQSTVVYVFRLLYDKEGLKEGRKLEMNWKEGRKEANFRRFCFSFTVGYNK